MRLYAAAIFALALFPGISNAQKTAVPQPHANVCIQVAGKKGVITTDTTRCLLSCERVVNPISRLICMAGCSR